MPDYEELLQKLLPKLEGEVPAVAESRAVVPAVKTPEVVGSGTSKASPSEPEVKDVEVASQQSAQGPEQAALEDKSGSVDPWAARKAKLKSLALPVGAAAAGTAAGLASGGGDDNGNSSQDAAPPAAPAPEAPVKAAPADEDNVDDEDEEAPTTSAKLIAKAVGPSSTSGSSDNRPVPLPEEITQAKGFSTDRLAQLQEQSNKLQALNNLARGMTNAVATAGQQRNLFDKQFEDQGKQYAALPEQYLTQAATQKMDPNSPASQAARNLANYIDPDMKVTPNMSAADLEKIFPQMAIVKNSEDANEMRGEIAKTRASDRQNALLMAQMRLQDMKDAKQQASYNQTVQQLESTRTSSPAVQQAEKDVYAASKANQLVKSMGGNPDKLNPQQVELLVSEVGKIASGQGTTDRTLDALTPATLSSKMANVWQNLANHPTPANAGAFVKQYQQYANDISGQAKQVIKDRYGRIINSRASQFTPDQLAQLNNNYINRFDDPVNTEDPVIKAAKMQAASLVNKDTKAQADAAPQQSLQDAAAAEIARRKAAAQGGQ